MEHRSVPHNSDEALDMTPDPPAWDFERIKSDAKPKNGRMISNLQWCGIIFASMVGGYCLGAILYYLQLTS